MTGRDIILKPRQLGFSTLIQAMHYRRVTTISGRVAVTISQDRDSTARLRLKFKSFYENMPDVARPTVNKDDKSTTIFAELESSNYIGTAGNEGFGRGDTIHHVHCSEFAFWPKPDLILTGLLEAVPGIHVMPDSTIIIESTPNGVGNTYHDMCMRALEADRKGIRGAWKLHFFTWWDDPEYQIPLNDNETLTYSKEERLLAEKNNLTPEQIKWRRWKIESQGEMFFQEYPEDPAACFLLTGRARFDRQALIERKQTQACDPIDIQAFSEGSQWRIYQNPKADEHYIIGADPSGSSDGDPAAAVVREWRTNKQVATLHGKFEPIDFAWRVSQLGHMYNTAVLGCERNGNGQSVLNYLRDGTEAFSAYPRLYVDEQFKYGWRTTHVTRPVMIDDLATEYRSPENYIISDAAIIDQAMQFVVKRNARAEGQKEDDLVMADAIAGQMRRLIPTGPSWSYRETI